MLSGIGTVLEDNPSMYVREVATPRQPSIDVVDSRLQTPLVAHLFIAGCAFLIYGEVQNDAKKAALEARGATVVMLPDANANLTGHFNARLALRQQQQGLHAFTNTPVGIEFLQSLKLVLLFGCKRWYF